MFIKLFFRGTDETFTKPLNEGRKNWMMAIVLAIMPLGNIQQVNAQNVVVEALPKEVVGTKCDSITLDPNISIKENSRKIDSLLDLHRKNNYATYSIKVRGHYVGNHNNSYDLPIGKIHVKYSYLKSYPIIDEEIIDILTKLYSCSLNKEFQVNSEEYDSVKVDGGIFYYLYTDSPLYEKIKKIVDKEKHRLTEIPIPKPQPLIIPYGDELD